MLSINMEDVKNVLTAIAPYLIVIGVALALAIIVTIACFKAKKSVKKLARKKATKTGKAKNTGIAVVEEPVKPKRKYTKKAKVTE